MEKELTVEEIRNLPKGDKGIYRVKTSSVIETIEKDLSESMNKYLKNQDWYSLIILFGGHFSFEVFNIIEKKLSNKEYWECLREILTGETILNDKPEIISSLINNKDRDLSLRINLMNKNEIEILNNLPDKIKIYRGSDIKHKKGFSWTIDINIAEKFAKRYENGFIYEMLIDKSEIIAYFDDRKEKEILIEYNSIKNIKTIKQYRNNKVEATDIADIKKALDFSYQAKIELLEKLKQLI